MNIAGAFWCMPWTLTIIRERQRAHDPMRGDWLAAGLLCILVGVVVGSGYQIHLDAAFSPGLPCTTAGLACVVAAQAQALKEMKR